MGTETGYSAMPGTGTVGWVPGVVGVPGVRSTTGAPPWYGSGTSLSLHHCTVPVLASLYPSWPHCTRPGPVWTRLGPVWTRLGPVLTRFGLILPSFGLVLPSFGLIFPDFPRISQNFPEFLRIFQNFQEFLRIFQNFQEVLSFSHFVYVGNVSLPPVSRRV